MVGGKLSRILSPLYLCLNSLSLIAGRSCLQYRPRPWPPFVLSPSTALLCGCQVTNTRVLLFSYDSVTFRPKRDSLLYMARHTAVALTWDAPLSQAPGPGRSVSRIEPAGGFLSRFSQSSSRSLGHGLLLGQRSRMNLCSSLIGSLLPQDHRNPPTEFARHRHNGDPGSEKAWMSPADRAEEFPQLVVLADGRPGRLEEFAPQPSIAGVGDGAPLRSVSRGVLGGHQAQKSGQLADIFQLAPIADPRQHLTCDNPAEARNRPQILDALRQFGIALTETPDLFRRLQNLLLMKRQTVEQLLELKADRRRTGQGSERLCHRPRPLAASRSRGKLDPFQQQQRFDPQLHCDHCTHEGVAQRGQMAQLAVDGRGHMDAFELSPAQTLRQSATVEPVGLHSLSWRFGNHRGGGDQTPILLRAQPSIQAIARGARLVGKGHPLIGKMFVDVVHKLLYSLRHPPRFQDSLMISKGHRAAPLVHIQSRKHIVVPSYKGMVPHRSASLAQWLSVPPLVQEHSVYSSTSIIQVSGQASRQRSRRTSC